MPLTKSARKALKVSIRRNKENNTVRANIKSAVKGARLGIAQNADDISGRLQKLYRELDIAAKKNVIHKNKAARLKSRITKQAGSLPTEKPAAKKTAKK